MRNETPNRAGAAPQPPGALGRCWTVTVDRIGTFKPVEIIFGMTGIVAGAAWLAHAL